jgi:hypothetical protein
MRMRGLTTNSLIAVVGRNEDILTTETRRLGEKEECRDTEDESWYTYVRGEFANFPLSFFLRVFVYSVVRISLVEHVRTQMNRYRSSSLRSLWLMVFWCFVELLLGVPRDRHMRKKFGLLFV